MKIKIKPIETIPNQSKGQLKNKQRIAGTAKTNSPAFILYSGTVPTFCILNVGTVPMLCILNVGTVLTFRHRYIIFKYLRGGGGEANGTSGAQKWNKK